jgi:hypothetical protein
VSLSRATLTDQALKDFPRLPSLWKFDADGTALTGKWLPVLANRCPSLEGLNLSWTKVTDETLADLALFPKLTHLWLNRTGLTNAVIPHLARCKSLKFVTLGSTEVDAEGVKRLQRLRPKLRVSTD